MHFSSYHDSEDSRVVPNSTKTVLDTRGAPARGLDFVGFSRGAPARGLDFVGFSRGAPARGLDFVGFSRGAPARGLDFVGFSRGALARGLDFGYVESCRIGVGNVRDDLEWSEEVCESSRALSCVVV